MRICIAFLLVLLFLSCVPVQAEINPSVDTKPFFCRYTLTDWTLLCPTVGTGGAGSGSTFVTSENTTFYYNTTTNESYIISNATFFENTTIGNNLTTISNFTYFNLVNITYSEMNQTPGEKGDKGDDGYTPIFGIDYFNGSAGPQGINGTPGVNGTPGIDGIDGEDGEDGAPGATGATGAQGPAGPAGADGAANMTAGPQGEKGEKGDKGDTGAQGPAGPAGADGAANMTAGPQGPVGPANTTMLNESYQTIANQSIYDIAVNTSMKNYVDTSQGTWTNWSPVFTWTGGSPTGVTNVTRYRKDGTTVFYQVNINAADGKGATALTIAGLPYNSATVANYVYSPGTKISAGIANDPHPYMSPGSSTISFYSFGSCANGNACYLRFQGFYEV